MIEDRESHDSILGDMAVHKVLAGTIHLNKDRGYCKFKYTFINEQKYIKIIEEHLIDVFNFDGKTTLNSLEMEELKSEIKEIVKDEEYLEL